MNDKLLTSQTKLELKMILINKIRNEKVDNTTNTNEISRIIRVYLENLFSNKLEYIE
jgi:hypothetical protein